MVSAAKQPVPALLQTLGKYLNALEPLVTPLQLEKAKKVVNDFAAPHGVGQKLQKYLFQLAQEKENWASDYCLNRVYLENRSSLPHLQNVVGVVAQKNFPTTRSLSTWVAAVIDIALQQKRLIERDEWPQEYWKGQPLCMMQMKKMFRCYRVPCKAKDTMHITHTDHINEHVVVMHHNQLYIVPLKYPDTKEDASIQRARISNQIESIWEAEQSPSPAVGLLTALDRDEWAHTRQILMKDQKNKENLRLVENCMMVVCLDEPENRGPLAAFQKRDKKSRMLQMFHGGGSELNGGNRWYDKDIQIVVSRDGVVGGIFEHSCLDGTIMTSFKTWDQVEPEDTARDNAHTNVSKCFPLEWNLTPHVVRKIAGAENFANWMVENLDYAHHVFPGYGARLLKSMNCSPNAFVQLAIQLAAYKVHGHFVNNYTSAHLRLFRDGRTEPIRPLTAEVVNWIRCFLEVEKNGNHFSKCSDLIPLFESAMNKQVAMTLEANAGQGIDVHLTSLCEAAKDYGEAIPEIFLEESYAIANDFKIVSGQAPVNSPECCGGFGPDAPDGRGIYYNVHRDIIEFGLVSWKSHNTSSSSQHFANVLHEVLRSMAEFARLRSPTK